MLLLLLLGVVLLLAPASASLNSCKCEYAWEVGHKKYLAEEVDRLFEIVGQMTATLRRACSDFGMSEACSLMAGSDRSSLDTRLQLDIVMLAIKPSCVHATTIGQLNKHLRPRKIHVVAQTGCSRFSAMAPNVFCHDERHVMPNVTFNSVADYIAKHLKLDGSSVVGGRRLAGWYLQQFLKLGAADFIVDADQEHFVLWDSDMIPVREMPLVELSADGEVERTIVHTGGNRAGSYESMYERLFGVQMNRSQKMSSFVAHHMVVRRSYLQEFLNEIDPSYSEGSLSSWPFRVLDKVERNQANMGFSEYDSYAYWVSQHYPDSQRIIQHKAWDRITPNPETPSPSECCPNKEALLARAEEESQLEYIGWEIGHAPACRYLEFEAHYP